VDVELARHQWAEGRRALDRARDDRARLESLSAQVEVLVDQLMRRVGQTFTLDELADAYERSDRWVLEALDDAFPDEVPTDISAAVNAAFDLYARRASNYAP
jgi:hypothetical protein